MMTLDQWKTYLMQNPQYGFQNTQGAKDMAEQLSSAILNEFGRVNTNGQSSQPFRAPTTASPTSLRTRVAADGSRNRILRHQVYAQVISQGGTHDPGAGRGGVGQRHRVRRPAQRPELRPQPHRVCSSSSTPPGTTTAASATPATPPFNSRSPSSSQSPAAGRRQLLRVGARPRRVRTTVRDVHHDRRAGRPGHPSRQRLVGRGRCLRRCMTHGRLGRRCAAGGHGRWHGVSRSHRRPGAAAQAASAAASGVRRHVGERRPDDEHDQHPGARHRDGDGPAGVGLRHHLGRPQAYGFNRPRRRRLTQWAWGEITNNVDPTQIAIDIQTPGTARLPGLRAGLPGLRRRPTPSSTPRASRLGRRSSSTASTRPRPRPWPKPQDCRRGSSTAEHRHPDRRQRVDGRAHPVGSTTP